MADIKIDLKLLVDKEKNRVIFAECDKDFVDVLFSFLTLPMGTIIRLAKNNSEVGCMDVLYRSVESLDADFFETEGCKSMLLRPKSGAQNDYRNLVLDVDDSTRDQITYYRCPTWTCFSETHRIFSMFKDAKCLCGKKMDKGFYLTEETISKEDKLNGVFVKGIRKFLISDDLQVRIVSTETSLAILLGFGIKDGSSVEERTVSAGIKEVLDLLKRSLLSKTPMTDVFMLAQKRVNSNMIKTESLCIKSESFESLANTKKMDLNLLIRKSSNKVLYAVVKEEFIDFLFSFLVVSLGSIVKLLGRHSSVGSIDNLYTSVEELCKGHPTNFQECKDKLLNPEISCHHGCENQTLQMEEEESCLINTKTCSTCYYACIDECSHGLGEASLRLINPKYLDTKIEAGGGYLKQSSMFMVTDELVVEPLSPISTISFVNKLGVPFDDLEERSINIGEQEALSILKAALTSKTVLTNVFCRK